MYRRPTRERGAYLGRERVDELRANLLGADEHDLRRLELPLAPVELLSDSLHVLVDELLDVPLVTALRPAALVALPGRFVVMLGDLLQPAGAKTVQLSLLSPDDRDDRPVPPAHERDERREVEVAADLRAVPDGLRQRECPPEVVEPGREDRKPPGAVPVEVVVEPVPDPLEVGLEGGALLVGQVGPVGLVGRVQHGVHPGLGVTGGRNVGRIEVQTEADCTALLRPEAGQLTQERPCHHSSHRPPLRTMRARILCIAPGSGRPELWKLQPTEIV